VITIYCLTLFGQLSFELFFFSQEDQVKLAYFLTHPRESKSPSSALLQPLGIDLYPKSV
jgi:hypothetical protein